MTGKILHYFVCGNTARGFYNLAESTLHDVDRLFILKSQSEAAQSSLIEGLGMEWAEKGYEIEFLHSPFDSNILDGVIIPVLKTGIIKEYLTSDASTNTSQIRFINLEDSSETTESASVTSSSKEIEDQCNAAYSAFAEALAIHDEWEKFFINNMDFSKANELTEELIEAFIGEKENNKKAVVKHRFLGAATPQGSVDFVPNLTEDIQDRYFIKGRPGSGKSTLLKKLAKQAEHKGFDVEIYHCGFDPNSLDMVILRELGIAIFDSTAPHEYFPERDTDQIIDMYGTVIAEGTDEKYALEIEKITQRYKEKVKEATAFLNQAKSVLDELENNSLSAVNGSYLERIKEEITNELKVLL